MHFGAFIHFVFLFSLCKSTLFIPSRSLDNVTVEDSMISCENGWMSFGQYCYKAEKEPLTWNMASVQCASLGGHLASIHSQEEQDFLTAYVLLEEKGGFWIGMHDKFRENKFIWEDGSDVNYTYWLPGEPIHYHNSQEEDCVEMFYTNHFKDAMIYRSGWNDIPCDKKRPYICQKEKNEIWRSENPLLCFSENEDGQKFRGSCYKFVFENKTWEDAEQYCQDNFRGHLVTISDSGVDWFLNYALPNFEGPFWIGIKLRNQIQQKWVSGLHMAYNNFLISDSSLLHDEGFCGARFRPKLWMPTACHHDYPFICEALKDDPPKLKNSLKGWKCPEQINNWRDLDGDFCYNFDTWSSITWYEAYVQCYRMGGDLTSILSPEESDILQPFVLGNRLWIGLNSILSDGTTYSWSDGNQMNYTHWEPGEPNRHDEKCVELNAENMKWNDVHCSIKRGFICSIKKVPSDEISNKTQCKVE